MKKCHLLVSLAPMPDANDVDYVGVVASFVT